MESTPTTPSPSEAAGRSQSPAKSIASGSSNASKTAASAKPSMTASSTGTSPQRPPTFPPAPTGISVTPATPTETKLAPTHARAMSHMKQLSDDALSRMRQSVRSGTMDASAEGTLRHFRLMEAIRTGDLTALGTLLAAQPSAGAPFRPTAATLDSTDSTAQEQVPSHGTPLHLAALFGSKAVMEYLLHLTPQRFPINAVDTQGNTPLHLACKGNRQALVEMLLKQSEIDYTVANADGKEPRDLTKNLEIQALLDQSKRAFVEQKTREMHGYMTASNFGALQTMFGDSRVQKLVDINAIEPITGESILHRAVDSNDYDFVTWCLKMKADTLVRDKRGKLAVEKAKSEKIKQLLKGGNQSTVCTYFLVLSQGAFTSVTTPANFSVKMQGVLYKWTNYASGYKKRWFVLEDGVLSYYRAQEDVPVACRGSISLTVAKLWIDSADRHRFDIVGRGNIRWHLRAEHPMEAKRWVIALTESKQWLQDNSEFKNRVESMQKIDGTDGNSERSMEAGISSPIMSRPGHDLFSSTVDDFSKLQADDQEMINGEVAADSFQAAVNTALACAHYQEQLLATASTLIEHASSQPKLTNLSSTFSQSSEALMMALTELQRLFQTREAMWRRQLEHEEAIKQIWEENLRILAVEHDALQIKAAATVDSLESQAAAKSAAAFATSDAGDGSEQTNEADEFFDAVDDYAEDIRTETVPATASSLLVGAKRGYPPSPEQQRKLLPLAIGPTPVKVEISLWSVMKNNIGKDLSKIALPVFFNEPLSMLQRLCEDMEYSTLLDIANSRSDSVERTMWVAAFAMSNYSSTMGRTGKPFNPLLGETYEYVRPDRGFRYLAEQPISACHCESDAYVFWAEAHIKNKFWGKSLEIQPLGTCHVILKSTNEHFSWRKVTTSVNNLIVGKLWIDHYGDMVVTNHTTGDTCTLTFKPAGWRGKSQYEIVGTAGPKDGPARYEVSGKWHERLCAKPAGEETTPMVLWKRTPVPADAERMFNFTEFAVTLNELNDGLESVVSHTDSRLRPDQRAMENGDFDVADKEKIRLEERQRAARHERSASGVEWAPMWFYRDVDEDSREEHWVYKGKYWESRESGQWPSESPKIFGK